MSKALIRSCMNHPLFHPQSLDEIFDEFFKTASVDSSYPPSRVQVVDDQLTVQFTVAGYPKDYLTVEASENTLTVKGEKVEGETNLFAGRAFTWARKDVTGKWDFNKAEVNYRDGLLTINVPKKEELKSKQLKIG